MAINTERFDFDPEYLRKKYRLERDKRLRQDGNDQYQEVSGEFSYFAEDPYLEETIERAPLTDEVEVVIIGGGFGGMLAGARLREAGIDDFRIIEKGETSAEHGTGIAIQALRAILNPIFIFPFLKKQDLFLDKSTQMLLKH